MEIGEYEGVSTFDSISIEAFAKLFGTSSDSINKNCRSLIDECDFRHQVLTGGDREQVFLEILKIIEEDTQVIGAADRKRVFEKGWSDNYQAFVEGNYDIKYLVPKYIRPNPVIRFNYQFIKPATETFELDYYRVFRSWLFESFLADMETVYEFGCGTGWNLVSLAEMHPFMEIHGFDFVESSKNIIDKVSEVYNMNVRGHTFDMLAPDESITFNGRSAIFTVGALEQLAGNTEPFLKFLLKRSPNLCINVEPILELYDESNLFDYLATRFHKKRGYTKGLLPRLLELEEAGVIEIIHINRSLVGNMLMDGYSLIIWRPKR